MSVVLVVASILGFVTAAIHIVLGHQNPVLPMLAADFDPVAKRTMHAVWHMATVTLLSTSVALGYLAFPDRVDGARLLGGFIGLNYLAFGALFVGLAVKLGAREWLLRLPQWTLLIPVGVLACVGTL